MGGVGSTSAIHARACQAANGIGTSMRSRPASFERDGTPLRPAQGAYDRASHVFHVSGLQSGEATAEHGIDRKSAQELEDGGEKRVVLSEHHGGANENCVLECGLHRQLSFAALTDVE